MDLTTTEELLTAEAKAAIMLHMNEDHGKHMTEYAQYLGGIKRHRVSFGVLVIKKIESSQYTFKLKLQSTNGRFR